jgi:predicted DNA-binding transcriptional regulator YafY
MNETRKMLKVLVMLGGGDLSAVDLAGCVGVSVVTLKRYIAEARGLGARVESYGGGRGPWFYRLLNWDQIRDQVELRVKLERLTLTGAPVAS